MDAVDNFLVLFGGYEGQRLYNDLRLFNVSTSKWINISPSGKSQAPSHRYGHSSLVLKDGLMIFGGIDKQKPLNDLWRFCFVKGIWTPIHYTGLISPLFRSTLVEAGNNLLIMGGAKGFQVVLMLIKKYTNQFYFVNLDKCQATKVMTNFSLFSPRCLMKVEFDDPGISRPWWQAICFGWIQRVMADRCILHDLATANYGSKSLT